MLLLAEIYRRGTAWKLRALGQGYADGLAGIARDFGVEVSDDADAGAGGCAAPGDPAVPGSRGAGVATALNAARAGLGRLRGSGRTPSGTPTAAVPRPRALAARRQAPVAPFARSRLPPDPPPTASSRLVNSARAAAGAPPVSLDARLTAAAQAHAAGMAARGSLGSEGADGLSVHQRVTAGGYAYLTVGEHLVSGPRDAAEFVEYCLSGRAVPAHRPRPGVHRGRHGVRPRQPLRHPLLDRAVGPAPHPRRAGADGRRGRGAHQRASGPAAGLPPLAVDALLTNAAQAHSADMVARAFYSHTSPDGSEPWHRAAAAGSTRRTIGENIACGQRSAAEVVQGWMDSPGHRANILKPAFTHIGVGFAGGGSAGTYWTQLFGA